MTKIPDNHDSLHNFMPPAVNLKHMADQALIIPKAYKDRCKLELSSYRQLRTNADVMGLNEAVINSCIAGIIDINQAKTISQMALVQLQAIRAHGQGSDLRTDELDESVTQGDVSFEATDDELRAITTATTRSIQIKLVNRMATKTTIDTKTINEIPAEVRGPIKAVFREIKKIEREDNDT
jgi:hypothetical protein